jgi:hypothetical protein
VIPVNRLSTDGARRAGFGAPTWTSHQTRTAPQDGSGRGFLTGTWSCSQRRSRFVVRRCRVGVLAGCLHPRVSNVIADPGGDSPVIVATPISTRFIAALGSASG